MARTLKRHLIGLDISLLTDTNRLDTLTGIQQVAPTSTLLIATPAIQASFAALVTKGVTFKKSSDVVTSDRQKLKADTDLQTTDRTAFDGELRTLKLLTETGAKNPADLTGMGFKPPTPPPPKGPPLPPEAVDTITPTKGHGKIIVSAHQSNKKLRRHYVVQWSLDPVGPNTWSTLVGTGKSRTLTGASGTHVWVRYATVRGQIQSDWGTPVLVTIP